MLGAKCNPPVSDHTDSLWKLFVESYLLIEPTGKKEKKNKFDFSYINKFFHKSSSKWLHLKINVIA